MENFKSEKLYIRVFNEIRKYIVKNNLSAGDKLPTEHEMCEMLGVSRNVVREAIKAMEIFGVLKSVPGRGILIQEFNMDFIFQHMFYYLVADREELITEILEIRKTLELGYMREAFASVTDEDIRQMRALAEAMAAKAAAGEISWAEDKAFHCLLFKNVNNRTLESIMTAAWNVEENFQLHEKKKQLTDVAQKHLDIVEALEQRDVEKFEQSMHAHWIPKVLRPARVYIRK